MATASTSTVIDQTSDAGFQAWVTEMVTQLAGVGLTQTSDTGQLDPATATIPGTTNTSAGYTIWQFNDTLQATNPIFIKLEFGTGAYSTNDPQMWITTSTGTDGAGTLNATGLSQRVICCSGTSGAISLTTNYISRWCYNATYGFLGVSWKIDAPGTTAWNLGGFFVGRSNDSSGVVTGDAVYSLAAGTSSTGRDGGFMQIYSWLTSTLYPTGPSYNNIQGSVWGILPFNMSSSTNPLGNYQVMPGLMYTPNVQFTNQIGVCLTAEIPLGTSFTTALIGSTPATYINSGGAPGTTVTVASGSINISQACMYMLWQ